MADETILTPDEELAHEIEQIYANVSSSVIMDDATLMDSLYYLWILWADFTVFIDAPRIPKSHTPTYIYPDVDPKTKEVEEVYRIVDWGDRFTTSRGEDIGATSRSMAKTFNTIEKVIGLMLARIKEHMDFGITASDDEEGGTTTTSGGPEARIAFAGHELCQRKAFESVINLKENVVVTNFDPGDWGQRHLDNIKRLADKGYGLPSQAPRTTWKHPTKSISK